MLGTRVLLVDDDRWEAAGAIADLVDAQFDVTIANKPAKALREARKRPFDVVVLDIRMQPGDTFSAIEAAGGRLTGLALARELRQIIPDAKLVAWTLSEDPEVQEWFTRDHSVAYLNKREVGARLARNLVRILHQGRSSPRVFIVHGHDSETLLGIKDVLQNHLGFRHPIVLVDMPSKGMTLIEKFEYYASEIDLVFVLITPDDSGALAVKPSDAEARARQNVVFELGYFLGALRRKSGRVFVLRKGEVELPSDLAGIVCIDISDGVIAASERLRRELVEWLK